MTKAFVHESAYVDQPSHVGPGTKVWHFCHIMPHTTVGQNCSIGQNCVVGPRVTIGNGVKVQNNISIYEGVEVEDDVFLGPSMVFTNVINPRSFIVRKSEYRKTLVRRGASIGANTTVVCGVTIGEYAFVGAGTVVTKDIPAYALFYGVPGAIRGWVSKGGHRLEFNDDQIGRDPEDGSRYRLIEGRRIQPLDG